MPEDAFVPDAGDIVWINFDPQVGQQHSGHRPTVVLSPAACNARVGRIACCPTTTKIKGYPFEVALSGFPPSVALADQVKSFDWRKRAATKKGSATRAEIALIRTKLRSLIGA